MHVSLNTSFANDYYERHNVVMSDKATVEIATRLQCRLNGEDGGGDHTNSHTHFKALRIYKLTCELRGQNPSALTTPLLSLHLKLRHGAGDFHTSNAIA